MKGIGVVGVLCKDLATKSGCLDELASRMKRELSQARNAKGFELTKVPVRETQASMEMMGNIRDFLAFVRPT